jgi:hypothetical protein
MGVVKNLILFSTEFLLEDEGMVVMADDGDHGAGLRGEY